MYKYQNDGKSVIRLSDSALIPADPNNLDYVEFIEWVNNGGVPSPAEPKPTPTYQELRAEKYPPIADQLDMLWHAIDSGVLDKNCDFYFTRKAVKDAIPKI